MICVCKGDLNMLVGKKELKSAIVQETILTLIDNGLLEEAKDYYFANRELLDEGWLDKFIPPAMRRDWGQVAKDQEDEEKVAAAVEKILDSSPEGKRWEKEDLKKVVKQYQAQGGGKAIGGRWDLTPAEEKMVMSALDAITDNPADVENAKRAADAAPEPEASPAAPERKPARRTQRPSAAPGPKPVDVMKQLRQLTTDAQGISAKEAPLVDFFAGMIELAKKESSINIASFPEVLKAIDIIKKKLASVLKDAENPEDYLQKMFPENKQNNDLNILEEQILQEVIKLINKSKRKNVKK